MDKVAGRLAGSEDEAQPAATLASGPHLAAADKIAFRDDADELAGILDHSQAADMPLQHDVCRLDNAGAKCNRDHPRVMIWWARMSRLRRVAGWLAARSSEPCDPPQIGFGDVHGLLGAPGDYVHT